MNSTEKEKSCSEEVVSSVCRDCSRLFDDCDPNTVFHRRCSM